MFLRAGRVGESGRQAGRGGDVDFILRVKRPQQTVIGAVAVVASLGEKVPRLVHYNRFCTLSSPHPLPLLECWGYKTGRECC